MESQPPCPGFLDMILAAHSFPGAKRDYVSESCGKKGGWVLNIFCLSSSLPVSVLQYWSGSLSRDQTWVSRKYKNMKPACFLKISAKCLQNFSLLEIGKVDPGEKLKVPGEICWSLKKVPGKMRRDLGKWLQASFLDGGKGIMGKWVEKWRSSRHLGSWEIVWMLNQGKKDMFPVPGKSLLLSVFSLENEHTKDWKQILYFNERTFFPQAPQRF